MFNVVDQSDGPMPDPPEEFLNEPDDMLTPDELAELLGETMLDEMDETLTDEEFAELNDYDEDLTPEEPAELLGEMDEPIEQITYDNWRC